MQRRYDFCFVRIVCCVQDSLRVKCHQLCVNDARMQYRHRQIWMPALQLISIPDLCQLAPAKNNCVQQVPWVFALALVAAFALCMCNSCLHTKKHCQGIQRRTLCMSSNYLQYGGVPALTPVLNTKSGVASSARVCSSAFTKTTRPPAA